MVTRRRLIVALTTGAVGAPLVAFAQQASKVPRVAFLMSETLPANTSRIEALRDGLRELGYVEGKNISIELRPADGDYDRLPELATELVRQKVDVIVAFGTKAVSAAVQATSAIPIVDPSMGDPVGLGLSSGLARPGKNVTGIVQFSAEAGAKRVEFLKQALPDLTRVAVLVNPINASTQVQVQAMRATAKAVSIELRPVEVRAPKELPRSIAALVEQRVQAVVVSTDTLFRANLAEIADLVTKHGLPSIGPKEFAAVGGFMGYSSDVAEMYHHAAKFVDKILKGAKPDDIPIERVTKLELVINLKTARALGLTVPQSLLLRADEVIQ